MNFSFDFTRKRVLVTGGVSGIGRAVSMAFLASGAEVVACGLTEQELAAARADPAFARINVVRLDVTDKAAVDALIAEQPSLDVVVTSAGIIRRDAEHDPEVFDQVIDVNVILSVNNKLQQKAEIALHVAGKDLFAECSDTDLYAAIDCLIDKLDRQVIKHKQKRYGYQNQSIKHQQQATT